MLVQQFYITDALKMFYSLENNYIHSYFRKYYCQQLSIPIKTQERWIIFNKNNLVAVIFITA